MTVKKSAWLIAGLVIIIVAFTLVIVPRRTTAPAVTNFEQCVAAGYNTTLSHPSQCRTPDGTVFTQEVPAKNQQNNPSSKEITNFEQCAQAGNPILESFPEQCSTPDGRSFTRELTEEEKKRLQSPTNQPSPEAICTDKCGDGVCQEIVCLGSGCPCPETKEKCAKDCGAKDSSAIPDGWQPY